MHSAQLGMLFMSFNIKGSSRRPLAGMGYAKGYIANVKHVLYPPIHSGVGCVAHTAAIVSYGRSWADMGNNSTKMSHSMAYIRLRYKMSIFKTSANM